MPFNPFLIRHIQPRLRKTRWTKPGDVDKNIRPSKDEGLRYAEIEPENDVIMYRRGHRTYFDPRIRLEERATPPSILPTATLPERIVHRTLRKINRPFVFQGRFEAGREALGGIVVDFVLQDSLQIIYVNGETWHVGQESKVRDFYQHDFLRMQGYEILVIWDYEIYNEEFYDEWVRRNLIVPTNPRAFTGKPLQVTQHNLFWTQ